MSIDFLSMMEVLLHKTRLIFGWSVADAKTFQTILIVCLFIAILFATVLYLLDAWHVDSRSLTCCLLAGRTKVFSKDNICSRSPQCLQSTIPAITHN